MLPPKLGGQPREVHGEAECQKNPLSRSRSSSLSCTFLNGTPLRICTPLWLPLHHRPICSRSRVAFLVGPECVSIHRQCSANLLREAAFFGRAHCPIPSFIARFPDIAQPTHK